MCQKVSPNRSSSPAMTMTTAKITILLIIFYFVQNAAGGFNDRPSINKKKISSCINYGHSCWGAHGKRNDPTSKNTGAKEEISTNEVPIDTRWFLSRLSPSSYKTLKSPESQGDNEQSLKEMEFGENVMRSNLPEDEVLDYQELPPVLETFYPEDIRTKALNDKLRFLNFLKSQKLN